MLFFSFESQMIFLVTSLYDCRLNVFIGMNYRNRHSSSLHHCTLTTICEFIVIKSNGIKPYQITRNMLCKETAQEYSRVKYVAKNIYYCA